VAVAIALLKKDQLGDLEGGLALLREAVEAARRNPDVRAENRDKYAEELQRWEALPRITLLADGEPVPCTFGFGPAKPLEYSGAIVATEPARAEAPLTNAADLRRKLALMVRKPGEIANGANRAAKTGVVAVIVVHSEPGDMPLIPGDPDKKYKGRVPVLGVSASVGERLGAAEECCLRVV
jgi:hypothetical protein